MKRKYAPQQGVPDRDVWDTSLPKLPKGRTVTPGEIHGVLPFDGVRNPSALSSVSHKVFLTYRTAANDWRPKIGIAESAVEAAVALEAAMSPEVYDLSFQPCSVSYLGEDGKTHSYTHDLLITFRNGRRRLVFVRNGTSLRKPKTHRQIAAIAASTPKQLADELIVANGDDYSRQRRDNLMRMHHFVFHPDDEADGAVLEAAQRRGTFYYMKDLFSHVPVSQPRAFAACHRLVARGAFRANLDNVLWENSRLELAA